MNIKPTLKPIASARKVALMLLQVLAKRDAPLAELLQQDRDYNKLEGRDRAFAHTLILTSLRRRGELAAMVKKLVAEPDRLPDIAHPLLHLGLVQILYLDTPAHAAVGETVNLVETNLRGLVNAVLRRAVREKASLLQTPDAAAKLNTPPWLWQRWQAQYGLEKTKAIAMAHQQEPPLDLTLLRPAKEMQASLGGDLLPNGSLRLRGAGAVVQLPHFNEGAFFVQDAAAALPVHLLGNVRGLHIIDLCAAPGGKTCQLAHAGAKVTAVDESAPRLATLHENLARLKLEAHSQQADSSLWVPPAPADALLLDAPCSATGTLRRHPDLAWRKKNENIKQQAELQTRMLRHIGKNAARFLRKDGHFIYAVCSLEADEGIEQIARFLAEFKAFSRQKIEPSEVFNQPELISEAGDLRTLPSHWPEQGGMDGFYAARLVYSPTSG